MTDSTEVTELLHEWSRGDAAALDRLVPLIFEDLRAMARRHLAREPSDHTLQPTALVNEVYLRLLGQNRVQWQNRQQFFAIAATLMRRILVDHAKGKRAEKRGGGAVKVPLDEAQAVIEKRNTDFVALDEALSKLAKLNPRQARVVELKYVVGLGFEDIAEVLEVSVTTVKRDWHYARLFLKKEMSPRED
ncbi:MAG TPA: sigma-70 family RNA polymerase sigma factor [Thermoanaerobaculia bacterium]|nr:sigma-70 family RNA polymerase sigma factor [Thermoanaerobaculia bacterium]